MNKMINDFLPVVVFFIIYKAYDIYYATASLIIITVAQVFYEIIFNKKIPKMQIVVAILVIVFGGATLYFHNDEFIKWKVSIINWLMGIAFIINTYFMKETFIEKLMKNSLSMDIKNWKFLNNLWGIFFIFLGILNIIIAMFCSTDVWVNFKVFGILGLTFLFVIVQSIYISKYMKK